MPDGVAKKTNSGSNTKPLKSSPSSSAAVSENHIHALSSFCQNPVGVAFQSQDADETVVLLLRRHFITNVPWIFLTIVLLLIPLFITAIPVAFFAFTIPPNFVPIVLAFYYLMVISFAFVNFIDWFYNVLLVTNKRVVDVDYTLILYHDVAITKLNLIEDVSYKQVGFLAGLFNFGDIFIQTAGSYENVEA